MLPGPEKVLENQGGQAVNDRMTLDREEHVVIILTLGQRCLRYKFRKFNIVRRLPGSI